jgi:5'-3' exonuclease
MTTGFSASTPSGAARPVPRALAARACHVHGAGEEFCVPVPQPERFRRATGPLPPARLAIMQPGGPWLRYTVRMIVHLVDGTYELFRHFFGLRRFTKGADPPYGAVLAVLRTMLQMIESDGTYIGVATDHVIESFRNELWPGYKTGEGIEPTLRAQFHPLEDALAAMGVAVWPMVELEADDGLASAAHLAAADERVLKVCIWTPDKDLAQCVRGSRVVQVDRRGDRIRDAGGVREKFGVPPELIPDYLALVGDSADGYPGLPGIGAATAARLLNRHGPIAAFPADVLSGDKRELALLFRDLATLRTDAPLFRSVDELRWRGPTPEFAGLVERFGDRRIAERAAKAATLVA